MELVCICFIRILYETEKALTHISFAGFYLRVIMELSCIQETSDWLKEKLPEWSFCTMGAGTGLFITLECKTALFLKGLLPCFLQRQAFTSLRNQT